MWLSADRSERYLDAAAHQHIGQADDGCDFDFLEHGASVPEPEIH